MPLSTAERSLRATRARIENARKRRHLSYVEEIEQSPSTHQDVAEKMAETLRELGYTVSGPDTSPPPPAPADQAF